MGLPVRLAISVAGIYIAFLTWSLVHEPLTTRQWPNSGRRFEFPSVVALVQGLIAIIVGMVYLKRSHPTYRTRQFMRDHGHELLSISLSQSISTPLASYSLKHVDFLTYMLAKSCKLVPVLVVHLLVYRTNVGTTKTVLALIVTCGVLIFNMGGDSCKSKQTVPGSPLSGGVILLLASLLLDGYTNASQDRMLKRNRSAGISQAKKSITGAHLMVGLNICIVLWNVLCLVFLSPDQFQNAVNMISKDSVIIYYLATYAICGALGQVFIFFTLENYGSLVLVTVTVTRKMFSMILSIVIYRHQVSRLQWVGVATVFGGIVTEAALKRKSAQDVKKLKTQ
ncbi:LAMI_0C02498g1_1 [Lachancea mirantina]|uniref:UDP-galactose transporter homolog 1 n=1 Tax=Lachancea mirantina TaxID=1230905 RepID=A0A1G4J0X0_9SACH|nr:LAMI_0C02498g1_1 [Lachancea mirantina]